MLRASVIVFPGSNCDRDVKVALERVTGFPVKMVWHGDASVPASDLIVLPGGFSYGDYLRCGAMAAHSPIMRDVIAKAKAGTPVLGICNGFQVLCESGLLPGVLMRNASLQVHLPRRAPCASTTTRPSSPSATARVRSCVCRSRTPKATTSPTRRRSTGSRARAASSSAIATRTARSTPQANPNGAQRNIAGICDETRPRARPDAAPRAAVRAGARRHRRPPHVRKRAAQRLEPTA